MALTSLGLTLPICKMGLGSLQVFLFYRVDLSTLPQPESALQPKQECPHHQAHTWAHPHMGHMGTRGMKATHTHEMKQKCKEEGGHCFLVVCSLPMHMSGLLQ